MTIPVTDKMFPMDKGLSQVLDSIAYNVKFDFDSIILVSGSGMVRIGKSKLAKQCGYYLAWKLKKSFTVDNIVFSGKDLIQLAKKLPKNSIIVYDEGKETLDAKKVLQEITQTLLDFFAEAGIYNHICIIVLPDFFDLPKWIATSRSEVLLNVTRNVVIKKDEDGHEVCAFERGYFEGYHKSSKKQLYMLGKKKFNDYSCVKRDFFGEFSDASVVDEEAYMRKKMEFVARDRTNGKKDNDLDIVLSILCNHISLRQAEKELKEAGLKMAYTTIQARINKIPRVLP